MTVLGCCGVVYLPITELRHPIKRYVRPTKDFKDLLSRTFFGSVTEKFQIITPNTPCLSTVDIAITLNEERQEKNHT